MKPALKYTGGTRAFTLMEVVLAVAISAVVLISINAVLFGAMRMQAKTTEITDQTLPADRLVSTMKRDLLGIVPIGNLAGPMGTDATATGMTQPALLEIFTASGSMNDATPWGDIQKIDYSLQAPTNGSTSSGRDLMRGITRNLLASTPDSPTQQVLISDVQNLQFSFFDGTNWNDSWSTTLSNIPWAIKVSVSFAPPKNGRYAMPQIQFLVPVVMQTSTNK
jgi:type II secretion system protein J